jgi:hypothetical protein
MEKSTLQNIEKMIIVMSILCQTAIQRTVIKVMYKMKLKKFSGSDGITKECL